VKQYLKSYLLLGGIAGFIILVDQITKLLVRQYLPLEIMWMPDGLQWLQPYARFYFTQNTGASFGMLKGFGSIFSILALVVSAGIIYYFPRVPASDWTLRIALSMQLAGALGNVIDRLLFGYVTDFISVGTFAIFNVADSSITVGVAVLLLGVWLQERKKPNQAPAEPPALPAEPLETPPDEAKE
jgi:signal peptidase II